MGPKAPGEGSSSSSGNKRRTEPPLLTHCVTTQLPFGLRATRYNTVLPLFYVQNHRYHRKLKLKCHFPSKTDRETSKTHEKRAIHAEIESQGGDATAALVLGLADV